MKAERCMLLMEGKVNAVDMSEALKGNVQPCSSSSKRLLSDMENVLLSAPVSPMHGVAPQCHIVFLSTIVLS